VYFILEVNFPYKTQGKIQQIKIYFCAIVHTVFACLLRLLPRR
jgi:hypothetical protein